ncbi:MAG: hypothetical protein RMY34_04000 [Aulosira sp. DedQUE10]|nr:hypothetical protein [Aulosira sp. DedQUE10]
MRHDLLEKIESIQFSTLLGLASSFDVFCNILHEQSEFQNLIRELLDSPQNCWDLLKRVANLSQEKIDETYDNPWDTAIAVYLYVLSLINLELAQTAASFALGARNSWWTRKLASYLLRGKKTSSLEKEKITFESKSISPDFSHEEIQFCSAKNVSNKASVTVYNYSFAILTPTNASVPIEKKPSQKLFVYELGIARSIQNAKNIGIYTYS